MISERQGNFHRVHGNFMFFLWCVAFLMIMVLSPARGDDASRIPQRTRSGYSTTYRLTAGWNMISINLDLDGAPKALLQGKGAMVLDPKSKVYAFNGDFAAAKACWICCHGPEEIILSGAAPDDFSFETGLKPGWNFAGPLCDLSLADGAIAWGWNGRNYSLTENLLAGHGYWIYLPAGYVVPPSGTYLIIDLSAGPEATSYPVTYRFGTLSGAWSDEYKTTKLVLRRLPAGTFMMGSPAEEYGRKVDETQHQVILTKDFYMGVFEVTQKQWNLVMGTWPSYFNNVSYRDSRPVEEVSYANIRGSNAGLGWPANNAVDADSFLGRLRAKTGLDFDLPTEAQWEYACRARTTTSLNSGKNVSDKECRYMALLGRCWYNGGSNYLFPNCDTRCGIAKVGTYMPNRWGLYDMHGNVWEWCLDWYKKEYENLGSLPQIDPRGPAASDGVSRVSHGGSWCGVATICRSANRWVINQMSRSWELGFRLALTLP